MKQHLDPEITYFPPTYILNKSKFTAKIINDDTNIFRYEWRLFGTKEEEEQLHFDIYSPEDRDKVNSCLLFKSNVFSIEPISGMIPSHLSEQFVITFAPTIPNTYKEIAYLYNIETEERIPYEINATGIQPSAEFSISQIDVMHVPLDKPKTFVVDLRNTGKVAFDFEYEQRKTKHLQFTFTPESGHLEVGESVQITVLFAANYVGQFNETFHYKIVGFEEGRPSITFFGRVIGASYSISTNKIDFGNVSYGFLYSKEFEISNTSSIPFDYALTFKQDKSFDIREFSIRPSLGSVPKHSKQIIHVEFIPISVQTYEISLLIAGTKSEENYGSMKIYANCICPVISLSENVIDLGNLFIHHEYTTCVNLVDDSDFPAKYEFIEVDDESTHDMAISFVKYKGSISPHSTFSAPIKVIPKQLGHLQLFRSIRIYGSNLPPIDYTIKCLCTGPNLVYSSNIIDFGNTPVLQDVTKVFSIKNDSLIPATFTFTLAQNAMFTIDPLEGEIKPGDTLNLAITANLDDSISYNSSLIMNVQYLSPITFELKAKGTGTAIVSSYDMKQIDMGFVFTLQPAIFDFTLINKGRRTQEIKWVQQKPKIEGNSKAIMNYTITPDSIEIAPKQSIDFRMKLECNLQCAFSLIPVCQASIGKQRYDLFKPEVKGIFIKPMITFGSDRLTFTYTHDVDQEEKISGKLSTDQLISPSQELLMPITYGNTIKNNSELPLEIQVQSERPFETSPSSFFLQPQEIQPFNITFNTSYKKNFQSETIERKIRFAFHDNPQKYNVNVKGVMIFPNLSFSPNTTVNFGTLLKGTEETKIIKVTNTSRTQARFFWELKNKQTFDIYPINDILEPDETKDVHISFFASDGNSFKNTAVCHVIGGPEYPIELAGSSSAIDYKLDKRQIDFGQRDYMETLSDKIVLTNNSRVPIQFNVKLPKGLGFQTFSIEPHKGVVNYKESVTFSFKIVAGFPRTYNSLFMIQIGHFDEVQIDIHVDCYIPQLTFSVPHYKSHLPSKETESISTEATSIKGLNSSLDDERKYMIDEYSAKKNPKRALQKLGAIYTFRGIYLSSYLIDFGEIILGDNKTMNCELKNVTPYPISFDINQNSLSGTGFSINSASFRNIPTDEIISITVNFNSDKRTHANGTVDLQLPLIFNSELGYMIHIKAEIKMPYLHFSKTCLTFEPTIIGQKWTQTFQLQNMNPIPVSFKIGEFQNVANSRNYSHIFTCFPTNGILPAYSFLNIELTFAPTGEINYQMQFPINIKYSDQVLIQVQGSGIMMKLAFDPPNINFNSIQPFNEKSIATVDLVNNSSIEIEVYSRQFDFELLCNQLTKKVYELNNISPNDIPLVSFSKPITNAICKYSQIIIVHGPPKSGKTTVSEKIAEMLQIPILNLKSLIQDKIESSDEEIISLIQDTINDQQYLRGFVVDGLDAFPENNQENEQFIMHFLKQKNTLDELAKNPYTILNDPIITTTEKLVNLLISALDGQYVFFIGLNANETSCHSHESKIQDEERRAKITQLQEEMNALFNMDEDAYLRLSEEEQKAFDEKRERYRRYKIEHNGDFTDFDPFEDEDASKSSNKVPQRKKSKVSRGQIPNDPLLQSVILFQYTFGRISSRIQNDSKNIKNLYIDASSKVENDEQVVPTEKVEQAGKKKKEEQIFKSIQSTNCLIVNSFETIDVVMNEITSFLPQREEFITKASHIPPPRCELPDSSNIDLIPFPQWFTIINEEPPGDFPDILKPVSPTAMKRPRKNLAASQSIDIPPMLQTDVDLISDIDVMNYTPRWKIPARSRMTIKLSFDSICQGTFSDNLLFGLTNCRNDIYKLPVQGKCDYPEIDRSIQSLVPKIVNTFPKKHSITNVFVQKTEEFFMGSVLIVKERTRNGQAAYKASLNLLNNSEFTVETRSDLKLSGNKVPWVIENPTQKIPPGETGNIVIGFNPSLVDTFRNRLTVMVKDNPEPLCLDLIGEGCIPACEISTTSLDFDKLLPGMSRTLSFNIKNTGKLSAFWKMKGGNVLGNNFTLTATEGLLTEGSSVTVEIKYQAEKAFVAKKTIQIDIFDVNKNRSFTSHHLNITAETFDVLFDLIYPKGMDHLNFGTLKVGQEKTLQCQLKNKGKYQSEFSIFTSKTFKYTNLFTITPKEGAIPTGDKLINVNFTFKCESSKKFTSCSGINLSLSDPINNKVTSTITIPFSVETVYSHFAISPDNFLDFGPIPISTTISKEIILKNNGVFPFEFEILPKIEIVEPPPSRNLATGKGRKLPNKKGNTRTTAAVKGKKKGPGKDFQIDHFNVGLSAGTVNNESEIPITVSFTSNADGVFENTIIYKIGDCLPKYKEGFEIKLKAAAYIPGIITADFEKIFPNQHLCLRYDITSKDMSAFIEDEQIWHFSPVVVKQSSKVQIALINPLPISCTVDMNLKPRQRTQGKFPFELSSKSVNIDSNSTSLIDITFSPNTSELYRALFEATVRGGINPSTKSLKFGIEGPGALPSVVLVECENPNTTSVLFGKSLIKTAKHKRLSIQNNGIIPATIKISTTESEDFELENSNNIKQITLEVRQLYTFHIIHCPLSNRKSQFNVLLEVENNPNSNINIECQGEGFREDVFFEGIQGDENELRFNSVIGQPQQITFQMRNVCDNDVRFVFPNHNDITFSPRIGQILHGKKKKITVTFMAEKQTKYNGLKMNCQWQKIKIQPNQIADWDDSMKIVKFVDRSSLNPYPLKMPSNDDRPKGTGRRFPGRSRRVSTAAPIPNVSFTPTYDANGQMSDLIKIVEVKPEPQYTVINGRQKDIQLRVFAVNDIIKYTISTTEIEFASTMMFEKRTLEFQMTNTSQISFDFKWRVKTFDSFKTDYSSSHTCPFSIQPPFGSIEADQTTTFLVNFVPEEVDDFSAQLICDIPYLTELPPPEICVTGRSRRPVCHFDLETSDYISAGRRHPDYTDPLPENIKVIEMFAFDLNKNTIKKFGILNTTNTPYEVTWERISKGDCPITCDTPHALISSGRKHMAQFSYKAVSVKTVESLWVFSIPEYHINITFLIVGRMMPR